MRRLSRLVALRRVLGGALRDEAVGDERPALELALEHDLPADLELVGDGALVDDRGGLGALDVSNREAEPVPRASPSTGPTTTPPSCTSPSCLSSSLG